jgi:hypothetical protein
MTILGGAHKTNDTAIELVRPIKGDVYCISIINSQIDS